MSYLRKHNFKFEFILTKMPWRVKMSECDCEKPTWLDKAERTADNLIRIGWLIVLYMAIFHNKFIVHIIHTIDK